MRAIAVLLLLLAAPAFAQDVRAKEVKRETFVTYDVGAAMNLGDGARTPSLQKPWSVELVTEAAPTVRIVCAALTTNSPATRVLVTVPATPEPRFVGWFYSLPGCQGPRYGRAPNVACPSCPVTDPALVGSGQLVE